jgi:cyclopropane-fatty-acyl-phospholipid synthase
VFSHRRFAYPYRSGWMARNFFTAWTMPSNLLPALARSLTLEERCQLEGNSHARTAEAWLERLDAAREEALAVLADRYGAEAAPRRLRMWRVLFMTCAELWGFSGGTEWGVSHYRFGR